MKTNSFYLFLLLITTTLATSCTLPKRIDGSGNVTKEERAVTPFSKLDISIVFDAEIIPGNMEKVVVETDDNLQQFVIIENHNNTLVVKMKEHTNIGKHTVGKIDIYTKGVETIDNKSVGKLSNRDTLMADDFKLNNTSVGNTSLTIRAKTTTIKNSAVGQTILQLNTEKLDLNNSAVGNTVLSGKCPVADIKNSSVGSFSARKLYTEVLHINNSAVGKTEIFASTEFYIENTAVGRMDVYGPGAIRQLEDHGIEKIKKH